MPSEVATWDWREVLECLGKVKEYGYRDQYQSGMMGTSNGCVTEINKSKT